MHAVIAAVVSVVLTALVANRLLVDWQHRVWVNQQRLLLGEKEYNSLRELSEEIPTACARRLGAARDLCNALGSSDNNFERSVVAYAEVVQDWNKQLVVFLARLWVYGRSGQAVELEEEVHAKFREIGRLLEAAVRSRQAGGAISINYRGSIERKCNDASGAVQIFSKSLIRDVASVRKEVYGDGSFNYSKLNLDRMTVLQLIQFLFEPISDQPTVSGPTRNFN